MTWLNTIAVTLFSTAFGIFSLNLFIIGAAADGSFFKPVPRKKKEDRLAAQSELWDLSTQPLPGFYHRFYPGREGVDLHYVEGGDTSAGSPLVIFVHGFPDSWFIWHHQLSSPSIQQKAHILALDLPGYGGSGNFPKATPTAILTVITEFIIAQKVNKSNENCILVAHDWGGIVGLRLASEVGFLFSRCIILNAVHPTLIIENAHRITSPTKKILHTYLRNPFNLTLLRSASHTLHPLISQLRCSYYIFVFLLPFPLARTFPLKMADFWFLRTLSRVSQSRSEESYLASSWGPSSAEVEGYPSSVRERIISGGDGNVNKNFDAMIAYYRDNLAFGKWRMPEDIQLLSAANEVDSLAGAVGEEGIFTRKTGGFTCPTTLIYCEKDRAFHRPFCFEGIEEYFLRSSEKVGKSYLLYFPKAGHWTQVSSPGRECLEVIIEAELDEGVGAEGLRERVGEVDGEVRFEVER